MARRGSKLSKTKDEQESQVPVSQAQDENEMALTEDLPPPPAHAPHAQVYVCKNGENSGCRYYATRTKLPGGQTISSFIAWIDPPKMDLKGRLAAAEKRIEELEKQVNQQ